MTPNADVTISALDDWQTLRKRNLNVVVDPMVFRSADVFFRGRKGSIDTLPLHDAEQIWRALTADPGSLALFFDQLVLSERLLIDYDITYDPGLGYDVPWIARFINERIGEKIVSNGMDAPTR